MKNASSAKRSNRGDLEERMVVHRQLVEAQHPEDRPERPAEHAQLERDRNERGPSEERLAADRQRIGHRVDPGLERESGGRPAQAP